MSHFTEIKVTFKTEFEAELIKALETHFGKGKIKVSDTPIELNSYYGEKASKAGLGHTEKCHVVVDREVLAAKAGVKYLATNDAGFARQSDGSYRAFLDEAGFPTQLQGLVAQSYSLEVADKTLQTEGYSTNRINQEDGTIRLEARIWE